MKSLGIAFLFFCRVFDSTPLVPNAVWGQPRESERDGKTPYLVVLIRSLFSRKLTLVALNLWFNMNSTRNLLAKAPMRSTATMKPTTRWSLVAASLAEQRWNPLAEGHTRWHRLHRDVWWPWKAGWERLLSKALLAVQSFKLAESRGPGFAFFLGGWCRFLPYF